MKNPIAKTSGFRPLVTGLFLSLALAACQKENLADASAESDLINVPNETLATTSTISTSTPTILRIEAENYANMYGVITEASSEGGKNVGAISPTDWMDYSVNVPAAGSYKVNFRVAGPGGQFQLKNAAGTVLATVTAPKTSGYQGYTTVSVNVNLAAGQQTLRIYAVSGGYNINWFELVGGSTGTTDPSAPTPPPTTIPTPTPVPSGPISPNITYHETFDKSSVWPGGLGNEWNDPYSFSVVTSPAREGAKAGRFELRDGDADDLARSEVRWPSSYNGADRWFSFWVYWPSNGQATDSKPEIFHQTHQTGKTSPPMSMVIKNGKMWAEINGQVFSGVLGQGSGTITTDLGAVPKDQWVKFVIHYKFSYNTDGKWQIWKNGQQIYNYSGKTIYPPAITSSLPSFKLGIYKWPWAGTGSSDVKTRIMYVDDVRIGNEKCTYNDL